ncbi:MAG: hypothetical protein VX026_13860, partial [Myxococcota bacterium]|nr:hypothetical protein [Myxococcota bacterium]
MFTLFALSMAMADRLIVDFQDGLSLEEARTILQEPVDWVHPLSEDESLAVVNTQNAEQIIDKFGSDPRIEAIELSIIYQALAQPNDPLYPQQWNLVRIGAEAGWASGGGNDIVVAV